MKRLTLRLNKMFQSSTNSNTTTTPSDATDVDKNTTTNTTTTTFTATTTTTTNDNTADPFVVFRSSNAPLELRVVPSVSHTLCGVQNKLNVLFQIKTGKIERSSEVKRAPIELCIVLDRSGSMAGEKLHNSQKAINRVIENLNRDDSFHLVTYDDSAQKVIVDGDLREKDKLCQIVNNVRDGGSTNLCAGVKAAHEIFARSKKPTGSTRRIFLFSDGLVNVGVKDPASIRKLIAEGLEKGIETASFGVGHDFDEDLMKSIAETGHSNYFYIERADQIDKFVSAALGSLMNLLGKNAVLKVRGKNGAVVTKIFGHDDLVAGAKIHDIKQDNLKNILTEVDFTPRNANETTEIVSYELSYTAMEQQGTSIVEGGIVKVTGSVELPSTDNDKLVKTNDEVAVAVTIQKTADMDEKLVTLLEQGKYDEAMQTKNAEIEELERMEKVDKTSRISSALSKARKAATDLKAKPDSAHMKKEAKMHAYLKRMDSADYLSL